MKIKEILKKVLLFIIGFIIFLLNFSSMVHAADSKITLEIVQNKMERGILLDNQGYFDEEILFCDSDKREVIVQFSLTNSLEKKEAGDLMDNMEIVIILPEDPRNQPEKQIEYVETLATKVLTKNPDAKIGIVGLRGPSESTVPGAADDAECVVGLTNKLSDIKNGLKNMNPEKKKYLTNLESALKVAREMFSSNSNKILISLFDGVPVTSVGTSNLISYSGDGNQQQAAKKHLSLLVKNTKAEVLKLRDQNIQFILLRPDDTLFDVNFYSYPDGQLLFKVDGKPYADDLYGTLDNPTYGKMYSLNNDSLEKIVTEYVYSDIIEGISAEMTDINISEKFSEKIMNNFTFELIDKNVPSSSEINFENSGKLEIHISRLESKETATFKYSLKLKENLSEDLFNKTIDLHDQISVNYINYKEATSGIMESSTPSIRINKITEDDKKDDDDDDKKDDDQKDEKPKDDDKKDDESSGGTTVKEETPKKDDTTAKENLPKAGLNLVMLGALLVASFRIIILGIKFNKYKDVK